MRSIVALGLGGALALAGCGSDSSSGGTGGGDGSAPVITDVAWADAAGCMRNIPSDVVITVTATDADTDAADLIYSGNVAGCIPRINAAVTTTNCPNVATYPGTVVVSDPEGNNSTPVTFEVPVCASSSCTENPGGCSL
jgi:hypothetical protein